MSKTQHNHEAIANDVLAQLLTQRGLALWRDIVHFLTNKTTLKGAKTNE